MKQHSRKILAVALTLALLLSCCPVLPLQANAVSSGTCGDNLTWTLDDAGTLTISGTGAMADYASASGSPWYTQRGTITQIVIEDGVTTIGARAFYNCTALIDVSIGKDVTTIGTYAFRGCTALRSVTIPASVAQIDASAFRASSNLATVIFEGNAPTVGNYAFNECASAITMKHYEGTTGFDASPWTDFTKETMHVGQWIVDVEASCTNEGSRHIDCTYCGKTYTQVIPAHNYRGGICADCGAGEIVASGTCGYSVKWSLDTFGTLRIFGSGSMYSSGWSNVQDKIQTAIIGDGVTSIGSNAFDHCSRLTSITIPDSVTDIGYRAFFYCESLTSITIPESVTSVGDSAFYGCTNLTSITIPDSVTTIGEYAFRDCARLTSIIIPESVTTIGEYAFYACDSLASITISGGVTYIGSDAFGFCSNLQDVYITDANAWCNIFFANSAANPMNYANKVHILDAYGNEVTELTLDDSVTTIHKGAFKNCTSLTGITIPDSVTTIGEYAFYGCTSLTSVTIGDGVTDIGYRAFSGCSSLTSVTIGNSVTSIGSYAFSGCSSLTSVTIGNSVTSIGEYAFYGCTSLTSITIPDSVTTIGGSAFYGCSSLTSVTIGNSVTSIGDYAFYYCISLTSVTIPESVTSIGGSAFYNCSSLTSITIPDSVTTIGSSAFRNCSSLTSITIPDSVTTIGGSAFYNCSSLADVYYTGTQAQWDQITIGSSNTALTNATLHTQSATLTGIAISTQPAKTEYWIGESLDTSGLTLTATYSDGTTKTITEGFAIIGFESNTAGEKTVTVSYAGKTATFTVTVQALVITQITVSTQPAKTEYWVGESLDTTGLTLTATYENGTTKTITEGFTTSGFTSAAAGEKTVTVHYDGKLTYFTVSVLPPVPAGIAIKSVPTKTQYWVGEELNTAGLTLTVLLSDGSTTTVTDGFVALNFDSATPGEKTVVVDFGGFTDTFTVTVREQTVGANDPQIIVESKNVTKGDTFTVTVQIKNNPGFSYLELTPVIDPALVLLGVENGQLINDFTAGNQYVWVADQDVATDGTLMTFTFAVRDNTSADTYHVGFYVRNCINQAEEVLQIAVVKANIALIDCVYGDATGDGVIDGLDVIRLKKYLANYNYDTGTSTVEIATGADATGDGIVDGLDVIRLKKYLANFNYDTGTSTIPLGPQ